MKEAIGCVFRVASLNNNARKYVRNPVMFFLQGTLLQSHTRLTCLMSRLWFLYRRNVTTVQHPSQVMKREREASQAVGKDYAARPVSYKGSLSLKLDRYTQRRKSRSRSPERARASGGGGGSGRGERRAEPSPPRRKAPVVSAEELRRQQELKKRYGDASASRK